MDDKPEQPGSVDELVNQLKYDKQVTPGDHYEEREQNILRRQSRMEIIYGIAVIVLSIGAFVAVTLRHPGLYFFVQTGLTITGILFGIGLVMHGLISYLRVR